MQGATVIPGRRITVQGLARRRRCDGGADRAGICGRAISTLCAAYQSRISHALPVASCASTTRAHAATRRARNRNHV